MLKLKNLKFKNVGRFVEPQEISFDRLGNLVQVDAQNNLTGGSSGSGKSTIFNALDWLLGLSDLSTSVLQSRLTKESLSVEGLFDWDGKEVRIHRAKKLSVTIDGVETTGSAKLAEEQIDLILGMPRHLFRQLLHRRQGESGFFLAMSPAQMNSFLTDCLNLAPIRSKIDVIDIKLKELAQGKDKAQSELQAANAVLDAIKSSQDSLGLIPTTNVTDAVVEGLKTQLDEAQATLEALKGAHKLEREALQANKPALDTTPYDRTQINALEAEIKALEAQINIELDRERSRQLEVNGMISAIKLETNTKISALKLEHNSWVSKTKTEIANFERIVKDGVEARNKAKKIADQLKELRNGVCFTCQQQWITQNAKDQENILLQELSQHKATIEKSSLISTELLALNRSLSDSINCHNDELGFIESVYRHDLSGLTEQAKPQTSPEFEALKTKILELSKSKTAEFVKEDEYKKEQNVRNKALQDKFYVEQGIVIDRHRLVWESVSKEVEEAKSQYERHAQTLASHLIALDRYKTSLDSLKKKEDEINQKVAVANQKLVDTVEKLEIAEEAKRCLKSYLSCSFDDALDSVSESATKILRSVPTMANATVRLEGTKELGTGALREQVNAILDNDGELEIPIKSLSGGERSAVDLAIDLAVCEMIQEKANKGIDIMILDEPFGGFDSIGIEQALEMLKTLDKRILIVEHNTVVKEFITSKVTVIREGETSRIG